MKSFRQRYRYGARKQEIWRALVDPEEMEMWGAGSMKMSEEEGEAFSWWGGSIYGRNVRVREGEKLSQEWYGGEWKQPSLVEITITEQRENEAEPVTVVELVHRNIPDEEFNDVKQGWRYYVFEPIKHYLDRKRGLPDVEYHQGG